MVESLAAAPEARTSAHAPHIVDVLIEERAPRLSKSAAWPVLRPPLYAILNYRKAVAMADAIAPMPGGQALDHVSDILKLQVQAQGLTRVPRGGSFILLANHPTGITDGVAVYDAIRPLREDVMFYANSDAHRVCPRFEDVLIPVEWVLAKRTRERTRVTLKMTGEAIAQGRPIVVFPAGRLARVRPDGQLTDPEWMASAVSIARKYDLPIIPCHVEGPWAFWFHTFDRVSKELRDMTLFHELLNKQGRTYRLTFGQPIAPDALDGEANAVTRRIKRYVERELGADPDAPFDPAGPECDWRDAPTQGFVQG
ncbi:MAG: GNAT family N-acetyltransferase [Hyphomonadaceae bacterium]